jgi:putative ABC transport system permease protein
MKQIFWSLAALLSHWRKHPTSLATLLIGLSIATALWSGVQALNTQARSSYTRAAAIFNQGNTQNIIAQQGGYFDQDLFIRLRRSGLKVSPMLEGIIYLQKKELKIIGVEPLTSPKNLALEEGHSLKSSFDILDKEGKALISPETLQRLGSKSGDRIRTDHGTLLPPLQPLSSVPPGVIMTDIGVAQKALLRFDKLSRLIVDQHAILNRELLSKLTNSTLKIVESEEGNDLERLTDSFHLNLTAFGMLAFVVGFFIVNASVGLAFEQRLPTLRTLRALGAPAYLLVIAMLIEIAGFTLIAGLIGVTGGFLIAQELLPNVAASLEGLYGAQISSQLSLDKNWFFSAFAMAGAGALLANAAGLIKTLRLPVLNVAKPIAWREMHYGYLRRQALFSLLAFIIAILIYFLGNNLLGGFIFIACGLLGAAMLLPFILTLLLLFGETQAQHPLVRWLFADGRQEIPGLSLALMALLLTLSANIGIGGMVSGFRETFLAWLDERLVAEIYYETVTADDAREIEAWARNDREIKAVLPVWRAKTMIDNYPVEIMGMTFHDTYIKHFPLLSSKENVWENLHENDSILISEQLAQRLKININDKLILPTSENNWLVTIAGIFPDYGNPKGQIRIDHNRLALHFSDAARTHYSLRVAPISISSVITRMKTVYGEKILRIIDQEEVKKISIGIFEKTFMITGALNTLMLIVSAVALFTSLLTLSNLRLKQIAPVWAIGVSRQRLAAIELIRILIFAAGVALVAIPLGVFITWGLVTIINVLAFGWRLPLHVYPTHWLIVFVTSLITAFFASLAPIIQLARSKPIDLLKVFVNAR